jgi:hypothetical protein
MQASSGCLGKVVGRPDGRAGLHPNLKYLVMNPSDALQPSVRPRDDSCRNSRLRSRPSHRRRLSFPYRHLPGPRSGVRVPPQSLLTTTGSIAQPSLMRFFAYGLATLLLLPRLFAQLSTYSGAINQPTLRLLDGGYATSNSYDISIGSAGVEFSVDPVAQTLRFDQFRVITAPTSLTRTQSITIGFGSTATFTTTITFDSIIFSFNDGVPSHALTAGLNGNYAIENTAQVGYSPVVGSLYFSGSYVVSGPTSTSSGTFNIPAASANSSFYMTVPDTIQTSNFPSELSLSRSNNGNKFYTFLDMRSGSGSSYLTTTTNDNYFVNTVVDGQQIQWGFWRAQFEGSYGTAQQGSLAAVPEPEAYATAVGLLCLAYAASRKRKQAKKVLETTAS